MKKIQISVFFFLGLNKQQTNDTRPDATATRYRLEALVVLHNSTG